MHRALVEKEVKDLIRDPRIWVPVLLGFLIFPAMGYVQNIFLFQQIASGLTKQLSVEVQYIGESPDLSIFSSMLSDFFKLNNISIAPRGSFPEKADALLIINASSIKDLVGGGRISAYIVYKFSLTSPTISSEVPQRVSKALTEASRLYLASARNLSGIVGSIIAPSTALQIPYNVEKKAIIESAGYSDIGFLALSAMFIPIIITIMIFVIIQYSATSMAIENEEKTLEILFSMPIPRWSIVVAKLSASAIIGGLSVIGFIAGFLVYQGLLMKGIESIPQNISAINTATETPIPSISTAIPAEIQDLLRIRLGSYSFTGFLDLVRLGPSSIATLAIYIVEATILAGVLGIIIGGLSSDVRMANTISGSITPPVIIFAISASYLDPQSMPGWLLLTNPLTGTVLYSRIAFSGLSQGSEVYLYLVVSGAVVAALIYLSGRMLSLETLERARRGAWGIFRRRRIAE
ncbi:MAG TPA: ABC transporter permease subunit [Sulfolobales archaeon]|nr:ABC transporter permease subunit [Sulfolobales archaeon]